MEEIESRVFGRIQFLDPLGDVEKFEELEDLIDQYPANAFGIINKKLNVLGLSVTIGTLKDAPWLNKFV